MEDLPPSLLIDILSRLTDSTDLARCRLVSKTLNAMSYEVRSLNHLCTLSSYLNSRSPGYANPRAMPFKTVFKDLVRTSPRLESVTIAVEKSLGRGSYDEFEDDDDDLYLTEPTFMKDWLSAIGGGLRSISVSDFWSQSSWRRSEALPLISSFCEFFAPSLSNFVFNFLSLKQKFQFCYSIFKNFIRPCLMLFKLYEL